MSELVELTVDELEASVIRRREGITLDEEAEKLAGSLRAFVRAAWHAVVPNVPYVHGWHIDTVCDHLEAVSAGEMRKLQIWVPPGTSKSTIVSICWPVWEWLKRPELRYLTASYDLDLSTQFAVKSRDLIRSAWFQARWPQIMLKRDEDLKRSYANTKGGQRVATSPSGGATGRHADRILIDDPLNAREVASEAKLEEVRDWHDGTISTRFANPKDGVEVIIQQRLAERDLAGHLIDRDPSEWVVLCLPERYEAQHPFVYPAAARTESGRELQGDIRTVDGDLLCPARVGEEQNLERVKALGSFRAAGQLQQRPAAREGAILKRSGWKFYPRGWREDDQLGKLPPFTGIVQSWDTAFKDKTSSDYVVGGVWGVVGADVYLLRKVRDRMSLSLTKAAMRELTGWAEDRWPRLPHRILIEKSANGVEIIEELRRELRGVTPVVASTSKVARAEAAEPALEAGNVYVPGTAEPDSPSGYAAETPADTQELIEECAAFPLGDHDDQVDMFTQVVNWSRMNRMRPATTAKATARRLHTGPPRRGRVAA